MQRREIRTRLFKAMAVTAGVSVVSSLVAVGGLIGATSVAEAATSPFSISGRGAAVPFVEQEAEDAATNGTVIGPSRIYGSLASEASGREAVTLNAVGKYVEFTLTKPANAVDVRYSIPDNSAGTGVTAPINLMVNGTFLKAMDFTSKYDWFYGSYPFTNTPSDGGAHHFYDDARTMFGSTLPAGTKVRFQVSSTAIASSFTIDLADFELVAPPLSKPAGAIDVVADYGADPTGATDSTAKIQAAVYAGQAQHRVVWIPAGNFLVTSHIIVDGVTLAGAGPWYTELAGAGVGVYGKFVADGGPSQNVTLKDFAIFGEVTNRDDSAQVNGIGGAMSNSLVSDLWIQHTKVGAWMDGPMTNFTITGSRILDTTADGVNFHDGVSNSTVTNTFVRNTGDDGLAMWADTNPEVGNSFTHDTVVAPVLANNIALYGGKNTSVTDNVVADTVTNGGGIHVANRYPGVTAADGTALAGTITVARNTLISAGNSDYNWHFGVGALWFDASNGPISGASINVTDTDILDSSYEAIQFVEGTITGVHLSNIDIVGTGTFAIQDQASGSASFDDVTATGIGAPNSVYGCGSGFILTSGTGNSGWQSSPSYCGAWPNPVYAATPALVPTAAPPTTAPPTTAALGSNLALGRPVSATSQLAAYPASNVVDGNASSYWESASKVFPESLTVDLGSVRSVSRVVVKLPPLAAWGTRSQTVAVSGSAAGATYSSLKPAAAYMFAASAGNAVTVDFAAAGVRYVRLTFTANSGWPAAQASEFGVYGPA